MFSVQDPAEVTAKLDALDVAMTALCELDISSLDVPVRLHLLQELETARWSQVAMCHDLIEPGSGQALLSLLEDLATLPGEERHGLPVVCQYVVLLWAISGARFGRPRLARYSDIRSELTALLSPFAVPESQPDPANPVFALNQSLWWEIESPVGEPPIERYDQLLRGDPKVGMSLPLYQLIAADDQFASTAVTAVTQRVGVIPQYRNAYERLLTELALTDIATVAPRGAVVTEVPLEQALAEGFTVERKLTEPADRERREAALQKAYERHLQSLGHRVIRKAITVLGQQGTLYTDLYDATTEDLIEVKSSSDRNTIRLALGQILDYARYVKPRTRTILLPRPPAPDLIDLLHSFAVQTVWLTEDHRFEHSRAGSAERLFGEQNPG